MRRITTAIALLSIAAPCFAQTATPELAPRPDFAAAKKLADRDEARMENLTRKYVTAAQSQLLNDIATACASPDAETRPFAIVVELDKDGKALDAWRQGDTKLAQCFEQQMRTRPTLVRPPLAPYYLSFEVSFTQ